MNGSRTAFWTPETLELHGRELCLPDVHLEDLEARHEASIRIETGPGELEVLVETLTLELALAAFGEIEIHGASPDLREALAVAVSERNPTSRVVKSASLPRFADVRCGSAPRAGDGVAWTVSATLGASRAAVGIGPGSSCGRCVPEGAPEADPVDESLLGSWVATAIVRLSLPRLEPGELPAVVQWDRRSGRLARVPDACPAHEATLTLCGRPAN